MPYILVVEDDIDVRSLVVLALQEKGHKVLGVSNGLEALNYICSPNRVYLPYLIILDLNMPIMSGREFLNVVRTCSNITAVPLILTTAEPDPPDGYEILHKPYSLEQIEERAAKAKSSMFKMEIPHPLIRTVG
jgi:CheY-like chemotaxis protein